MDFLLCWKQLNACALLRGTSSVQKTEHGFRQMKPLQQIRRHAHMGLVLCLYTMGKECHARGMCAIGKEHHPKEEKE